MDKTGYFNLTAEKEDYPWNHAVIVLDTSTLGNLYCMAEEPKQTLLDIFKIGIRGTGTFKESGGQELSYTDYTPINTI